jgi:hypothetical protein
MHADIKGYIGQTNIFVPDAHGMRVCLEYFAKLGCGHALLNGIRAIFCRN